MKKIVFIAFILITFFSSAKQILVPMDQAQKDHLKAYGVAFWVLQNEVELEWLLNYRGGSFLLPSLQSIEEQLIVKGVTYQTISDQQANQIKLNIANPEVNQEVVKLETAPKIAVYTPSGKQPWDDAVTLVLTYAEIPYDEIYDSTIVTGGLPKYDWLHLHHEDFTGQYGKFYARYRSQPWYKKQVAEMEASAKALGFQKVSEMKSAVTQNIRNFVIGGGFLFTMCSGTDSYDISLAATGIDICESMYDGDPADPQAQKKLDFKQTMAFKDFTLSKDPLEYEYSDIDGTMLHRKLAEHQDKFTLFDFSAKWDIVPTMLCQNHTQVIDGFMGQTTSFRKELIKPDVLIMGEHKAINTARYIHGELGKGTWTFYGGHDPEDYTHYVGDPPTDLSLHPNSPGYRLILNNILFPAAKKKKRKT